MQHPRDIEDWHRIEWVSGGILTLGVLLGTFQFWLMWVCFAVGLLTYKVLDRSIIKRSLYRSKRLSLPGSLATGIMAAEQGNVPILVDALYHRVEFEKDLSPTHQLVFDCLLRDILYSTPTLFLDLKKKVDQDAQASLHSN